jgi:RNA polymerase sigma factor for flagellar operon FliA
LDTLTDSPIAPELPLYPGVSLAEVLLVTTAEEAATARADLLAADVIGFDTESKPTFAKGEVSTGPHLIQLATENRVYLFQVGQLPDPEGLRAVLESTEILKAGFGLGSDLAQLKARLGIEPRNVLDLSRALRGEKPNQSLGAKTAVARFFGQRMQKSRKVTTSNWANPRLSERQLLYAANDAQVALRVYRAALLADPRLRPGGA